MKIALVCAGLGRVYRGFERYTRELFDLIKDDVDITLFKGGGPKKEREVTLPSLFRKKVPQILTSTGRDAVFFEQLTYSLPFIPWAVLGRFDLIHYSEPGLGNLLYHARRVFGFSYKTIFSHGLGMDPQYCSRADVLHQVSKADYDKAIDYSIRSRMVLIPYGIHSRDFVCRDDKASLRRQYNIPQDKTVLLCVSAINRGHKRIDYLVKEVAQLDERFFLLVAGGLEDPSIQQLANRLLPGRYCFLYVPFAKVPNLYCLADLYVHTALIEGFGICIAEAMAAGLPVITHDNPHFQWLTGSSQGCVLMEKEGSLSRVILEVASAPSRLKRMGKENQVQARQYYDWQVLKSDYLSMYEGTVN